jgi:hypothetical protein
MSRREKLIARFYKSPPPNDFRFDELVTLLQGLGFVMHEKPGGSSHKYFVYTLQSGDEYRIDSSRPHPGGILKVYQIKEIRARLTMWRLV